MHRRIEKWAKDGWMNRCIEYLVRTVLSARRCIINLTVARSMICHEWLPTTPGLIYSWRVDISVIFGSQIQPMIMPCRPETKSGEYQVFVTFGDVQMLSATVGCTAVCTRNTCNHVIGHTAWVTWYKTHLSRAPCFLNSLTFSTSLRL